MNEQAFANPQVLQNYYPQLYGMASPTASPFHHHQYVGYMAPQAPTPRALLPPPPPPAQQVAVQPLVRHPPPAQQVAVQALLQHPTPQIQGSFFPAPSLPHNFRLQLPPPQALSVLPPNTTGTDACISCVLETIFLESFTTRQW